MSTKKLNYLSDEELKLKNLPNHDKELEKVKEYCKKLKKTYYEFRNQRLKLNKDNYNELYEKTIDCLEYVGDLSTPLFEIEDSFEEKYHFKFNRNPSKAKKLWQKHYSELHAPYNLYKNRLFKIINDLNMLYIKKNNEFPPDFVKVK